ncbi:MAG: alpha/beta hydrolase [Akkermansia sp.]|nr:alpha/beta hydrolase [Akkermansia sp.]
MTSFQRKARTAAEARCRRMLDKAPSVVWKRFADGVELHAHIIAPAGHTADSFLPSVMFFSGGMWALDFNEEFVSWAMHLASRGIVCILPEYRNHARYEVSAEDIITDGLDAWRWVRHNAPNLGLDQELISLAGSDAGALLALNVAMQPMVEKRKWWKIGSRDIPPPMPASVAIFRGIVDVEAPEAKLLHIKEETTDSNAINPCALLRRYLPPLFCAHGMADPLLDYGMREWFCEQWRSLDNEAEIVLCPTGDHTLTHFDVNPAAFEQILLAWENFMAEQGIWPESVIEDRALMW